MSIGAEMMKGLEQRNAKLSIERDDYEKKWLAAEIRNKRLRESLELINTLLPSTQSCGTNTCSNCREVIEASLKFAKIGLSTCEAERE